MGNARRAAQLFVLSRLPPRQFEAIKLVACGLSNKEIATKLGIGTSAVKGRVQRAIKALGCSDRTCAVRRCIVIGLLDIEECYQAVINIDRQYKTDYYK